MPRNAVALTPKWAKDWIKIEKDGITTNDLQISSASDTFLKWINVCIRDLFKY